jgi:hypothetical protein
MSDPQDGKFIVDPATGLIPPCFATRPDYYGKVLCHAIQSTLQFQAQALLLSAFAHHASLCLFRDDPTPSGPSCPRPIRELAAAFPAIMIAALDAIASDANVSSALDAAPVLPSNPTPDFW